MAATLADIRAGLAKRLGTIPNVVASAYPLDSPPDLTLQVWGQAEIEYDQTMQRGLDLWTITIQGFSGSPETQAAHMNLDLWLAPSGPNSVKAAVQGDRSLGGIVEDCVVQKASGSQPLDLPSRGRVLYVEWTVLVLNKGS